MEYQLIFLGTAGGKESLYQNLRSAGGIVLNFGNYQMHLDPGPGALARSNEMGVNPSNTNVILCSHNHLDHCNDLNLLIDAMTFSGLDKRGILIGDKSVIEGLDIEKPILLEQYRNYLDKIISLNQGEKVKMGTVEVQALETKHRCLSTIGFKFLTARFTLSYTSDTRYFQGMADQYAGSDILIINNLRPFNSKPDNDSMSSSDSLRLIQEVKPKLAILTHFGKAMIKENPLYQSREIQKETKIQTIAAKDSLVVDPLSYSAAIRQKMLSMY